MSNSKKNPEKSVDLPPYGDRNADPLTNTPGSHPIETGVGATLGGAGSLLAVSAAGGPVGLAAGAAIAAAGAIAGGLAGKGVGELVDPTTRDNWLREYFRSDAAKQHHGPTETADSYVGAYDYGVTAASDSPGRTFDDVEVNLRDDWETSRGDADPDWDRARPAIRDAYGRAAAFRDRRPV